MPNFANISLAGHLGSDPELKTTSNDTVLCGFSMAVNTGFGDNKRTTWYRITLFGKKAEAAAKFLEKGKPVIICGTPYIDEWEDKDGNKRQTLKVTASDWTFAGSKEQGSAPPSSSPAPQAADFEDSIPF